MTCRCFSDKHGPNQKQHHHVRRIVNIEEPPLQFFVPATPLFPVIFPDRDQSKQCPILICEQQEAIITLGKDNRLQHNRSDRKEERLLPKVIPENVEDQCPY